MAFTPLLKTLNKNGTTFYMFSSAAKDLSKCLANSQKEFVFSHFACINIPDFINPANGVQPPNSSSVTPSVCNKNYLQFCGIDDSAFRDYDDGISKTTAEQIAAHLQDYVFNFEEKLLVDSDDNNTDRSVAERVFWHWMREVGAINWQFDESKIAQSLRYQHLPRFIEGPSSAIADYNYENVVKYLGDIDITNNVDIAQEAYTEIYIHIPSEVGNTPTVLFKQEFDGNFEAGSQHEVTNNQNLILGQTQYPSSNPIDIRALYDTAHDDTTKKYIISNEVAYDEQPTTNAYTTGYGDYTPNMYKTSIDGMCIDFEANSYNDIVSNNISSIAEFNKLGNSFEFNAVLVYYDIVDLASGKRTSNLYGILFLDDVKVESYDYFQRYPKYKPVDGVQNGNSFGFKLNLRIDVEPDKTGITTLVNEYNTFSMSLFSDAMTKMQDCADMFTRTRNRLSSIEERISNLETLLSSISNYEALVATVNELQTELENANLAFADRSSLLDLIAHVNDNVNSIISGKTNVQLQYNTDVIRNGYGTTIDSNTPNVVRINNTYTGYNITTGTDYNGIPITENNPLDLNNPNDTNNKVFANLKQMSNMLRLYTVNQASNNIEIHINSSLNTWKQGQNFKIVFDDLSLSELNNNKIIFIDDNSGTTHEIKNAELLQDNPIIEIICIDTMNLDFVHDILR